jgi:hypothetical protein
VHLPLSHMFFFHFYFENYITTRLCLTLSHKKHMSTKMSQSKEFNTLKGWTLKILKIFTYFTNLSTYLVWPISLCTYLIQPTYLFSYLIWPTYLHIDLNSFWPKFKKRHVTCLLYATCHNLKPCIINNEDPLSISKKKNLKFLFIYHMSLCNLLVFMVMYKWHRIVNQWWSIYRPLISSTLSINVLYATCLMQLGDF